MVDLAYLRERSSGLVTLNTATLPPKDPTAPKPWTASRTVILNATLTVVFALGLVGQLAGAFQIDPKYVALAGAAAAIINFYLRLDTNAPIAGTPAAAKAEVAKQDIAIHAALNAAPAAPPQPVAITIADVLDFAARVKQEQAALAQLAGIAAPTVPPGATPAPTTTG